jgi:hypothetical protein
MAKCGGGGSSGNARNEKKKLENFLFADFNPLGHVG